MRSAMNPPGARPISASHQRFRDHFAAATQVIERMVEIYGVPERDSGGDEGKPPLARYGELSQIK